MTAHVVGILLAFIPFFVSTYAQGGSLRLVGGGAYAGRVEIYYNGVWGTICDDHWDIEAARVTCRQLGFGNAISAPQSATFGEGDGPILLDDVKCLGNENLMLQCSNAGWYQNDCGHYEDASVVCTGPLNQATNETSEGSWRSGIRLVDGPSEHAGRVELFYQGEWGTVCDDLWDHTDGDVACRQLGFSGATDIHMGGYYPSGVGTILLENVQCTGFENSVGACVHSQWRTHDCVHSEDAGVTCHNTGSFEDGDVRLVAGMTPNEGRVEVYHAGHWGTVCDDTWGIAEADVVCRELGYESAVIARIDGFYESASEEQPISLNVLFCLGNELRLSNCTGMSWGNRNCDHSKDVGVVCEVSASSGNKTDPYPVRLVDGNRPEEGRVEVYHNGRWGSVCDSEWDIDNANVVCRQLGYDGAVAAKGNGYFGESRGYIMLDRVNCFGNEKVLSDCTTSDWYNHNCHHTQDAGVICATEPGELAPIRLAGGGGPSRGRLEVFHNGEWATVCDDEFEDSEAKVVCTQLGYEAGIPVVDGRFGEGDGRIALDEVHCRGDETSLATCRHSPWYQHDCSHTEDVGVICNIDDMTPQYTPVRLRGGRGPNEGRIEVYHDGTWGTVCDDLWDISDATVVCRQLGYTSAIEVTARQRFGGGFGQIFLDDVECSSTYAHVSLGTCLSGGWYNHNCDHSEDAGVVCSVGESIITTRAPWTYVAPVRLVGGVTANEGRVEVNYHGEWGTICDDLWDINDAHVVCRQLGFPEAVYVRTGAFYGQGTGPVLMDDVGCNGWESSISLCAFNGWYDNNCLHSEDAGVVCNNGGFAGYASIRLVGGSSPYEGRVEIYHDGQWGTVCGENWDIMDATVVCNQLGYFTAVSALGDANFGQGFGEIMLADVGCFGWESSLLSCPHAGWYNNDCRHGNDAGVVCWHLTVEPTSEPVYISETNGPFLAVRLVGGRVPSEGRVEISYNNVWGTICDDGWDLEDAEVICHQLGYPGARDYKNAAYFGSGTGPVLISQVGCRGYEEGIGQCQHSRWYYQYCTHFEDAGVVCQTSSETDPLNAVRLKGGTGPHEGRVEVFDVQSGQWGTICDDGWGIDEAEVTCRQLGYNSALDATTEAQLGQGTGPILYSNFECWGYETTLADCQHSGWREKISCYHGEDAGVVCSYEYGQYNGRLRLVNGATAYEGRVEIYFNENWGSVCDDSWDINAANVVCRQLGYGVALEAKSGAYYGQGTGPIHLDDFFCYGSELELAECNHPEWGTGDCSHSEDAGVICSQARQLIANDGMSDAAVAGISIAGIFGLVAIVTIISYFAVRVKIALVSAPNQNSTSPVNIQGNGYIQGARQDPNRSHVTVYTVVPAGHQPPFPVPPPGTGYVMHRHQHPPPPYNRAHLHEKHPDEGSCLHPDRSNIGVCQPTVTDAEFMPLMPSQLPVHGPAGTRTVKDTPRETLAFSNNENKEQLEGNLTNC